MFVLFGKGRSINTVMCQSQLIPRWIWYIYEQPLGICRVDGYPIYRVVEKPPPPPQKNYFLRLFLHASPFLFTILFLMWGGHRASRNNKGRGGGGGEGPNLIISWGILRMSVKVLLPHPKLVPKIGTCFGVLFWVVHYKGYFLGGG